MKFIHTADWQIGMKAAHAGESAVRVREARFETAQAICALARRERVDFLLLAGDTFEDNAVDREQVARIARLLDAAGCPVYVLPGNHDPYQPGCVWLDAVWQTTPNVYVLAKTEPVVVAGGVLLPCPLYTRRSNADPTAWIPFDEQAGQIRVVVAHGNVGEIASTDGGFPIPVDLADRVGGDYVALGHWHSSVKLNPRMAYSGTPETTRFGEQDSGNVLLVSIAEPGSVPEIQQVRTGQLRWQQIGAGETITARGRLAETARHLLQLEDPNKLMLHIELSGLLFGCDQDELGRIEKTCTRFLHARIDRSGLRPAPDDSDWVRQLPVGIARATAERLAGLAAKKGFEAEVATQALLELYAFAQEVRA